MAYSTDISKTLADQLTKFATLNRHQLAGHVANFDFWIGEVRHCLQVLDGYKSRFERMRTAQTKYVQEHGTRELDPKYDSFSGEPQTQGPPPPPKRIDHREVADARQSLSDAMYRFLLRCRRESMIDEPVFMQSLDQLGISYDPADVR
jgi:hypothetical protein